MQASEVSEETFKVVQGIFAEVLKRAHKLPPAAQSETLSDLAKSLAEQAKASEQSDAQFAIFALAKITATEAVDISLATEILNDLCARFAIDPLPELWVVFWTMVSGGCPNATILLRYGKRTFVH